MLPPLINLRALKRVAARLSGKDSNDPACLLPQSLLGKKKFNTLVRALGSRATNARCVAANNIAYVFDARDAPDTDTWSWLPGKPSEGCVVEVPLLPRDPRPVGAAAAPQNDASVLALTGGLGKPPLPDGFGPPPMDVVVVPREPAITEAGGVRIRVCGSVFALVLKQRRLKILSVDHAHASRADRTPVFRPGDTIQLPRWAWDTMAARPINLLVRNSDPNDLLRGYSAVGGTEAKLVRLAAKAGDLALAAAVFAKKADAAAKAAPPARKKKKQLQLHAGAAKATRPPNPSTALRRAAKNAKKVYRQAERKLGAAVRAAKKEAKKWTSKPRVDLGRAMRAHAAPGRHALDLRRAQLRIAEGMLSEPAPRGMLVCYGMGTGKTFAAVHAAHELYAAGNIDTCHVFTPANVVPAFEHSVRAYYRMPRRQWPAHFRVHTHDALWTTTADAHEVWEDERRNVSKLVRGLWLQVRVTRAKKSGAVRCAAYGVAGGRSRPASEAAYRSLGPQFVARRSPLGNIAAVPENNGWDRMRRGLARLVDAAHNAAAFPFEETWAADQPLTVHAHIDDNGKFNPSRFKPNAQGLRGCWLRAGERALVVLDESHLLAGTLAEDGSGSGMRNAWAQSVCDSAERVLLLTATPVTRDLRDLEAQMRFVDKGVASRLVNALSGTPWRKLPAPARAKAVAALRGHVAFEAFDPSLRAPHPSHGEQWHVYPAKQYTARFLPPRSGKPEPVFVSDVRVGYNMSPGAGTAPATAGRLTALSVRNVSRQKGRRGALTLRKMWQVCQHVLKNHPTDKAAFFCRSVASGADRMVQALAWTLCGLCGEPDKAPSDKALAAALARIGIITGKNNDHHAAIIRRYNDPNDPLHLLVFTRAGAQGMNLLCTQHMHVLEFATIYMTVIQQAIGRTVRRQSHWYCGDACASDGAQVVRVNLWLQLPPSVPVRPPLECDRMPSSEQVARHLALPPNTDGDVDDVRRYMLAVDRVGDIRSVHNELLRKAAADSMHGLHGLLQVLDSLGDSKTYKKVFRALLNRCGLKKRHVLTAIQTGQPLWVVEPQSYTNISLLDLSDLGMFQMHAIDNENTTLTTGDGPGVGDPWLVVCPDMETILRTNLPSTHS